MAKKERRRTQEIMGDGRGATIWFEPERLAQLDKVCIVLNCSRSWLVNQVIDGFNLESFVQRIGK